MKIWPQIHEIVQLTIPLWTGSILEACLTLFVDHRDNSFQLLGFDVLIDSNFKAYLLEVNKGPGLHLTTDTVKAIYPDMMENLFASFWRSFRVF